MARSPDPGERGLFTAPSHRKRRERSGCATEMVRPHRKWLMIGSKGLQDASRVLTSFLIVLLVIPHAIDRQLSGVFFLDIDDGHLGATSSAAHRVADLNVVFARHGFLLAERSEDFTARR